MKVQHKNNTFIRHILLLRLCLLFAVAAVLSTVGISHSADYANVEGFVLRPGEATVKINRTVSLSVKSCRFVVGIVDDTDLAPVPRLVCEDAAGDADMAPLPFPPKEWAVNGIPGGNRTVGTVTGNGWTATYKAPSAKPAPNTVAVSATITYKKKKGETIVVSNITITDQKAYTGTVQFSIRDKFGGEVSGSANVTWTEFENPEDEDGAEWYLPSGTITANIHGPKCEPLHVAGPVATGSSRDRKGGSMTIFPSTHPGQPSQYFFGLVGDRSNNINLYCGSPPNRQRIPVSLSHFVNFTTGTCGMANAYEPYSDTTMLKGKRESENCRISWTFTIQ